MSYYLHLHVEICVYMADGSCQWPLAPGGARGQDLAIPRPSLSLQLGTETASGRCRPRISEINPSNWRILEKKTWWEGGKFSFAAVPGVGPLRHHSLMGRFSWLEMLAPGLILSTLAQWWGSLSSHFGLRSLETICFFLPSPLTFGSELAGGSSLPGSGPSNELWSPECTLLTDPQPVPMVGYPIPCWHACSIVWSWRQWSDIKLQLLFHSLGFKESRRRDWNLNDQCGLQMLYLSPWQSAWSQHVFYISPSTGTDHSTVLIYQSGWEDLFCWAITNQDRLCSKNLHYGQWNFPKLVCLVLWKMVAWRTWDISWEILNYVF